MYRRSDYTLQVVGHMPGCIDHRVAVADNYHIPGAGNGLGSMLDVHRTVDIVGQVETEQHRAGTTQLQAGMSPVVSCSSSGSAGTAWINCHPVQRGHPPRNPSLTL